MPNSTLKCLLASTALVDDRQAAYIMNKGGYWYCDLCDTGPMSTVKVVNLHMGGDTHKLSFSRIKEARNLMWRANWWNTMQARVDNLAATSWQRHVKSMCLDFMTCKDWRQRNRREASILRILEMYERKEKVSLLELAVWKHKCIVAHAEATRRSPCTIFMQDIEDYWALDERFNPAQFRKDIRIQSGVYVIVECVLLFLGREF